MRISRSSRFQRAYKQLPEHIKNDFDKKIKIFIQNPRDSRLHSHKLKGNFQDYLAFNLRDGFRVFFEFSTQDAVNLLHVGPHDEYRKKKIKF